MFRHNKIKVKVLLNEEMINEAVNKNKTLKCPHVVQLFRDGLQPCGLASHYMLCNGYLVYKGIKCRFFSETQKIFS